MANYRNPNGYGSVVKLSGNRRNPFAVRKTVGYDDRAYPIYAVIGYFPTRKEAMIALAEYNHDPYDVDLSKITFRSLYERWSKDIMPHLGKSLQTAHRTSYKHCRAIYDRQYQSLRKYDMQKCIDDCDRGFSTRNNIKNLFSTLDKYAYDNDIISKCYSVNLDAGEASERKERTIFSDAEVALLSSYTGEPYIDETLFMLYTGCRVSEMLTMRCDGIDLEQKTIRGGIKTAAGKNRIIPIHEKLLPIIQAHLSDRVFLFDHELNPDLQDPENARLTYFQLHWKKALRKIGISHTTHECRHTFRSKLDSANANKVCIDLLMGHKSQGTGERIYTHKTIQELRDTIKLLSYSL